MRWLRNNAVALTVLALLLAAGVTNEHRLTRLEVKVEEVRRIQVMLARHLHMELDVPRDPSK